MTKRKPEDQLSFHSKLPEYECGLADAVRKFKSKTEFAKALGLGKINPRNGQYENDRQVVTEWFRRGAIPRQHIAKIHELTGVPLEKLLTPFKPYIPSGKEGPGSRNKNKEKADDTNVPPALKKRAQEKKKAV